MVAELARFRLAAMLLLVALLAGSAYTLTVIAAIDPSLAALFVVGAICALLLVIPIFRLGFVIFGGLLTLQSSLTLTTPKLLYLCGVVLAAGIALSNLRYAKARQTYQLVRPLLKVSVFFLLLCAIGICVALVNDTPATLWLRDLAPYALFGLVPLLCLDLAPKVTLQQVILLLLVASLLAAVSFGIEWLGASRRDFAVLPLTRIVLPSFFLAAAGFAYSVSAALAKRASLRRSVLSSLFAALVAVSGTRSAVALTISPIISGVSLRTSGHRWIRFFATWLALTVVGVALAATVAGADTARIAARFQSLPALVGDPNSDVSLVDRSRQTAAAWNAFQQSPIFGVGLGAQFSWIDAFGKPTVGSEIDTPLAFPAKFGLLGVACLLVCILVFFGWSRFIHRARRGPTQAAVLGYLSIAAAWLLLGSPFEDKGLSLGMLLLLIGVVREVEANLARLPDDETVAHLETVLNHSDRFTNGRVR